MAFVVRSTLSSADKDKSVHSVYLKIMTNHFQVLSAISNIDYQWPEVIEEFADSQNQVSSVSNRIFSFDCFLKSDGSVPVYFQKLSLYGLMPLAMALADLSFWLVWCTIKGRNYSGFKSKLQVH